MAIQCKSVEEDDNKVVGLNMGTDTHRGNTSKVRYRQHLLLFGSLLILLLIMIVIWMIVVVIKYENSNGSGTTSHLDLNSNSTTEEHVNITKSDPEMSDTTSFKTRFITRREWTAQPPLQPLTPLANPVPYVIILHTATTNCTNQAACIFQMRAMQTYQVESRIWYDISYNFAIGGDGFVYEGRGWKSEGAHSYGYNTKSIGIAFIGTFNAFAPPKRQISAAKWLIEEGVKKRYIAPDYKLLAVRQIHTTQSPGEKLYEDMKTWPHWTEQP